MAFFVLFQVIKWQGYKPMLGHDYIPQDSGGMKGNLLRGIVNCSGAAQTVVLFF